MPIHEGILKSGKHFFQFGKTGKKYRFFPDKPRSRTIAYNKCLRQAQAIEVSKHGRGTTDFDVRNAYRQKKEGEKAEDYDERILREEENQYANTAYINLRRLYTEMRKRPPPKSFTEDFLEGFGSVFKAITGFVNKIPFLSDLINVIPIVGEVYTAIEAIDTGTQLAQALTASGKRKNKGGLVSKDYINTQLQKIEGTKINSIKNAEKKIEQDRKDILYRGDLLQKSMNLLKDFKLNFDNSDHHWTDQVFEDWQQRIAYNVERRPDLLEKDIPREIENVKNSFTQWRADIQKLEDDIKFNEAQIKEANERANVEKTQLQQTINKSRGQDMNLYSANEGLFVRKLTEEEIKNPVGFHLDFTHATHPIFMEDVKASGRKKKSKQVKFI